MAPLTEVVVPDLGDFTDVPVIEILVEVGQQVAAEDPLITLESDKSTMEIPAPSDGVVKELLVKLGDHVSAGAPIVRLAAANGKVADPNASAGEAGAEDGRGTSVGQTAPDASATSTATSTEPPATQAPASDSEPVYASPSVRRLARELGVDLAGLRGTGRRGRLVPADVEAYAAAAGETDAGTIGLGGPSAGPAGPAVLSGLAPWPKVDYARYGEIERVALSRIQRIAGPNLARNWVMIPHVTHHEEADITELEAFRKQVNLEHPETRVTMVALMLKALVSILQAFPDFNASLDGDELVRKRYYHLGFAADTPQGLMVPVVRDVDAKGLLEIAAELRALSARAREGKLALGEMQGGTFTVSSLGGIGGTGFTPIINAPEVAILGVTRSAMRPQWDGSQFQPRLMVGLSLSYDHRVIDGAAAARFMVHLAGVLTDLRRVLL